MLIIDKLNLPQDLKKLNKKQLQQLKQDLIQKMIELTKLRAVHFSSNLGVVDLTLSLLKNFDPLNDDIFFDTGHQSYIYKMLTNRYQLIDTIRKNPGLSGFQDWNESKYDKFNAGHAGTALSVAIGMYFGLKPTQKQQKYVVPVIGDASLVSGISLEALEIAAYLKAKLIIVINDNGMSIGEDFGGMHNILISLQKNPKQKNNFFNQLGYKYIGCIDGHDINALNIAFKKAKKYVNEEQTPVIVHVKTIKGYGFKQDTYGSLHSYKYDLDSDQKIKESNGYFLAKHLINLKSKKIDSFKIISPSMTYSTGFSYFKELYPDDFIDLGIQEENAITMASGVSLENNYRPIVVTYATFLQRTYDELLHDNARVNLGMTILADRADLSAADGKSHAGIYDVGMLKSIPNTIITSGITKEQNAVLLDLSLNLNLPKIWEIRYAAKAYVKNAELEKDINNIPINYAQWQILKHEKKNKICFISYGTYYLSILQKFFNNENISFINALFIHGYSQNNLEWLIQQNFETIIVYERIENNNGLNNDLKKYLFDHHISNINVIALGYQGYIEHGELNQLDGLFNMNLNNLEELLNQLKEKL